MLDDHGEQNSDLNDTARSTDKYGNLSSRRIFPLNSRSNLRILEECSSKDFIAENFLEY